MINIKTRQKKIKVSISRIRKNIKSMLASLGYEDFDIGVFLTTNKTIKKFNKEFRKKDKATDILSFPYHSDLKPGDRVVINSPDDKNLGDIIISLEYAKKDAQAKNCSLEHHVNVLLAHGIAHLIGYDHKADCQYKAMQKKEKELLGSI